jgi:hypothetical protein
MYTNEHGWMYFWFAEHVDAPNRFFVLPLTNNVGPQFEIKPGTMLIGGRGGVGVSAERCPVSGSYFNEKGVLSWKPTIESSASDFYLYHMFLVGESYSCKSHNCIDSYVYDVPAEMTKMRNAKIGPDSNPPLLIMQGSRFALSELPKVPFAMLDNCLTVALAAPSFFNGQILTKYYSTRTLAEFAQDFGDFDACLGCVNGKCNSGVLPCKYYDTAQSKTFYTMQVYKGDLPAALLTFWLSNSADATTADGVTLEAYAVTHPGVPEQSLSTENYATGDKLFTTENKRCADGESRRRNLLSRGSTAAKRHMVQKASKAHTAMHRLNVRRRPSIDYHATDGAQKSLPTPVPLQRTVPVSQPMRKLLALSSPLDAVEEKSSETTMEREITAVDGKRVMADAVCGSSNYGMCELLRLDLDIPTEMYCMPEYEILEYAKNRLAQTDPARLGKFTFEPVSVYRENLFTKCFHSTIYTKGRRLLQLETREVRVSINTAIGLKTDDPCITHLDSCVYHLDLEGTQMADLGMSSFHVITDVNDPAKTGLRICYGGPECPSYINIANHTNMPMLPLTTKSDSPSAWAVAAIALIIVLVIALGFLAKKWYDSIPKAAEYFSVPKQDGMNFNTYYGNAGGNFDYAPFQYAQPGYDMNYNAYQPPQPPQYPSMPTVMYH